jgi:iron complex outermembrane receptor protein
VYGGLRQSFEEQNVLLSIRAFTKDGMIPIPPPPNFIEDFAQVHLCNGVRSSTRFDNLSPRYGLQLDATKTVMLYAQRQLGFKAGGVGPSACGNVYDPEDVDSKEVGVKSAWLDGNLVANVAYFANDYTNFQILKTQALEIAFVNAKAASIKGAEIELRARPLARLSKKFASLSLDVAAALLHARYEDFHDRDPANPDVGVQNLAGHELNRAPDYTVNVGIENEWKLPAEWLGPLRARVEWFKTDDVVYRPYGGKDDQQDGYSLWNAFVSVANASGSAGLRFFGKNLGGTEYFSMIAGQQLGTHYGQPGAPRTLGAELTLRL